MELREIKYRFVVDLTKFFIGKYKSREIKSLDLVIHNVKTLAPFVGDMAFTFDESIWSPDNPSYYENLIEFKVQLKYCAEYLPFRLFIDLGDDQNAIFIDDNMRWVWE